MGQPGSAGIAGSGINFGNFGTLSQLPDQGMLPGSTPNNQYFQDSASSIMVFIILTPCVPLSYQGEGEEYVRGISPL